MPAITKRALDERKKKLRHSKAEKEKNAAATLQDLASLRGEVEALEKQADPEKANEIAVKKKRLQDADKLLGDLQREKDEVEAEEKRANDMIPMDEEEIGQAPTSNLEGENVSFAAQDLDLTDQAEEHPSRNNLSQAGGNDNNKDKENDSDNGSGNGNTAYPTPVPSDNEEDEMPVMTVSDYKSRTGRPSTGREVIVWKPGGGRRGDVVITRYGPKSHPMFRIERASKVDGFDSEKIPDITNTEPQPYRIGERKQGRKWCYDYKHVDGIVAVAYTPMDDDKPLETINPAWYARHPKKRYAETQILIQWKNIAGEEGKKPRTWETRTTARRVSPMRGKKGEADKMFYERAKECETKYAIWLKDNSMGRDITMTPSPPEGVSIKVEEESEAEDESMADEDSEVEVESSGEEAGTGRERRSKSVGFKERSPVPRNSSHAKRSSLKSPKSTSATKIKEKDAQPEEIDSASATSQATSAPPLNKDEWLENYCELFGPKEGMDENKQAKMVNAWIKAKKAAASA